MPEQIKLTKNQHAVLNKLAGHAGGLIGREFADVATVTNGRWEWANAFLKTLEVKGLVRKTETRRQGVRIWMITEAGRSALQSAQVNTAPETTDAPMSHAQKLYLRAIATAHPWPEERCTGRATHEALERRGLIEIKETGRGWRQLRLTQKGMDVANSNFDMALAPPENPEDYDPDI
ncbi:hypothetical protein [Pseudosulfitobacter pseudonitzschiae]|uniref:hypothetical protein n=1 Tax=Pseudosulfitobacter pseudonitzschiae TaxID=1402135 RepID=UPI003B795CC3